MFKKFFIAAILFFCLLIIKIPGVLSLPQNHTITEDEAGILQVVRGAVEDTGWLYVSSRREMEMILGEYYTGPLLSELSEAAWNFITVPTDWIYTAKAENCKIIYLSGEEAVVHVNIIEKDTGAGVNFSNWVEYSLIKTENGWRINKSSLFPAP